MDESTGMQVGCGGFDLLSRLGHGDQLHKEARVVIERLHSALEDIASGELGINLCVKVAKKALGARHSSGEQR